MTDKEKPAVIDAADKLNDVIEDLALKAAGIERDGDTEHVAGATNEQAYVPEANSGDPGPAGMPLLERPHRKRRKQKKS